MYGIAHACSASAFDAVTAFREVPHMKRIDVSKVTELATVALLAGKVRLCLQAIAIEKPLDQRELQRLRRASNYLSRVLEGLKEVSPSVKTLSVREVDQFNAITSYRTAMEALRRSSASHAPSQEEIEQLRNLLENANSTLQLVLNRDTVMPEQIAQADNLFGTLAKYAKEEQTDILRAAKQTHA